MEKLEQDMEMQVQRLSPAKGDIVVVHLKGDVDQDVTDRALRHLKPKMPEGVQVAVFGYDPEDSEVFAESFTAAELKLLGRCQQCGSKGKWQSMALVCEQHGVIVG